MVWLFFRFRNLEKHEIPTLINKILSLRTGYTSWPRMLYMYKEIFKWVISVEWEFMSFFLSHLPTVYPENIYLSRFVGRRRMKNEQEFSIKNEAEKERISSFLSPSVRVSVTTDETLENPWVIKNSTKRKREERVNLPRSSYALSRYLFSLRSNTHVSKSSACFVRSRKNFCSTNFQIFLCPDLKG